MKQIMSTIIVAVSGSESSINALKYAIIMAKTYKVELYAVSVADTSTLNDLLLSKILIEDETNVFKNTIESNSVRYLNFAVELARSKGVELKKILKRGNVTSMILEASSECKANLLVLGGWETNRSITDIISRSHIEVMTDARIPVLVVKDPDIEKEFNKL